MLDKQDIAIIRSLLMDTEERMNRRFGQIDKRVEQIDERFEQIDKRFEQIDERFEQIDKRFEQIDERFEAMESRFDGRLEELKNHFEKRLDERLKESENLLLQESDRIYINLQNRIGRVEKNVQEIAEYYRIRKTDDANHGLLLGMIRQVEKRVDVLEKKVL